MVEEPCGWVLDDLLDGTGHVWCESCQRFHGPPPRTADQWRETVGERQAELAALKAMDRQERRLWWVSRLLACGAAGALTAVTLEHLWRWL